MVVSIVPKIEHDALEMIAYSGQPSLLLFADSPEWLERSRHIAELAGCRLLDALAVEDAGRRIDAQSVLDAVLLEVEKETPALVPLLGRLQEGARSGSYRSIVVFPEELIDLVWAHTPHPDVEQLCRPSDGERLDAVRKLARPAAPAIVRDTRGKDRGHWPRDADGEEAASPIEKLSEEATRVAKTLAQMAKQDAEARARRRAIRKSDLSAFEPGQIRALIKARRLREDYFGPDLFADPAWDMLLDLFAERLKGHSVSVSSLCIAARVPTTTALRWLKLLEARNLVVRLDDPQDGRRVHVELTDEAAAALEGCLKGARRISNLPV